MLNANRTKQQGVVLVIALIALVAISLAGIALMRTVDTSNVVSGNIAFNESAIQISDVGAEMAYKEIDSNLYKNSGGGVANCLSSQSTCNTNSSGQVYFYPNVFGINSVTRLPIQTGTLAWSNPATLALPGDPTNSPSFTIQYLIERMCTGTANLQEVATFSKCRAVPDYGVPIINGVPASGVLPSLMAINTTGSGSPSYGKLFYRITVQVTGPRNTRNLSQYFYGVNDTVYQ
jgi:hypothetical protein